MTKIIPISALVLAILGILTSLLGFLFALLSYLQLGLAIGSVYFLVISCITNAFPILSGVIFNSKLVKAGMVISIIGYVLTFISFVLLFAR